jgi:hypothetical protein
MAKLARDILKLNEAKEITITSKSSKFGADAGGGDYKTVLLFTNAGNAKADVTIAKGDSGFAAGSDLTFEVAAGKTVALTIDSALYKQFSGGGDYDDAYAITPSAAVSVSVLELPQ